MIKRSFNHFRYNHYLGKLTINHRSMWASVKGGIIKMWVDLEQHIPELIWQGQKHYHEESNHGDLQWKIAAILRERCISSQLRGKSSAIEGHNAVPNKWHSWQYNTAANSVCKQKLNKHWNPLQQHGMRSTRHTTWLRKFHCYCFAHKISVSTDHKLPLGIFKKDVTSLSLRLQRRPWRIH